LAKGQQKGSLPRLSEHSAGGMAEDAVDPAGRNFVERVVDGDLGIARPAELLDQPTSTATLALEDPGSPVHPYSG
jgi:hypothetical protein